jgi:hypothetical protein
MKVNNNKLLNGIRDFRGKLLKFSHTSKNLRALYSGSSENEKMINLMERNNDMMKELDTTQHDVMQVCKEIARELINE